MFTLVTQMLEMATHMLVQMHVYARIFLQKTCNSSVWEMFLMNAV